MRRLGFVPALDGIRGVAILAVTCFHFFGLSGGFYGVDLFFVLSGFLITTLLLEELDARGRVSLRAFYVRRARRLLPAVAAFLLAFSVFASVSYPPGQLAGIVASAAFYCLNIVGVLGHPLFLKDEIGHLWSLSQEEQFYLLWPVLLISASRRMRESRLVLALSGVFVCLVAYRAGLAAIGAGVKRLYFAPDTHADGLVLGCLVAVLRRRGFRVPGAAGWPALAGFVAAACLGAHTVGWLVYGLPLVELAAAVLLLAAIEPGALQLSLSWRPLVWLGALSYSLYLWQWMSVNWQSWVFTAVAAPVSYYLIERPFRRRKGAPAKELPSRSKSPGILVARPRL